MKKTKCVFLFSGGLDSLIGAKILLRQGIKLFPVHFHTPFFGSENEKKKWKDLYDLDVETLDISSDFIQMLREGPAHGYGKTLNPCVDCKILFMKKAREILESIGADFIASGEVLGQRPMSQRKDTLNLIQNKSGTARILLRPLSAQLLSPTLPETNGLVDRQKLEKISGRGRNAQLALAREFKLPEIPAPAGGCALTDKELARRYWTLLKNSQPRTLLQLIDDFKIMANGRLFYNADMEHWLIIGRNQRDNEKIFASRTPEDALIRLDGFAGPLALAREGKKWRNDQKKSACELIASYAPNAVKSSRKIALLWDFSGNCHKVSIQPERNGKNWFLPGWDSIHEDLKLYRKDFLEKNRKPSPTERFL